MNSIIELFKLLSENEHIVEIQKLVFSRDMKKELYTILNMSLASYKDQDDDEGYRKRAVLNYLIKSAAFYGVPKFDQLLDKYDDKITTIVWEENVDSYVRNIVTGFISPDAHYQDKMMNRIQKFARSYEKQLVSNQNRLFDLTCEYFDSIDEFDENRYIIAYLAITFASYQLQNYEIIVDKYNDLFSDFIYFQKSKITLE